MHSVKIRRRGQHRRTPQLAASGATSCTHPPRRLWRLEILAQSFAESRGYCPANAYRIFQTEDLTLGLERVATRIESDGQTWLAWTDGQGIRFFVAQMAPEARGNGCNAAIHLFFYDVDGQLQASGIWTLHSHGFWDLHRIDTVNTSA